MKWRKYLATLAIVAVSACAGWLFARQSTGHAETEQAMVAWTRGGPPGVRLTVVDTAGKPLSNAGIVFDNDSGGDSVRTDHRGTVSERVGEFTGITIGGVQVMSRPLGVSDNEGMTMVIVVKDPQLLK